MTFVNDAEMRRLNCEYRRIDKTTDVLSFSIDDDPDDTRYRMYGDIVISIPTALRYARKRGVAELDELLELVIHGSLHLLGYEDEYAEEQAEMLARQSKLRAGFQPTLNNLLQKSPDKPTTDA